jgi:hypothetical protein
MFEISHVLVYQVILAHIAVFLSVQEIVTIMVLALLPVSALVSEVKMVVHVKLTVVVEDMAPVLRTTLAFVILGLISTMLLKNANFNV